VVEGTEVGGKVFVVRKNPEFIRDIAPFFAPSLLLVLGHIFYIYTGKLVLPFWLMYLMCPISNFLLPEDNQNLSKKSEKTFFNDRRFWLPLYSYDLLETITWLWGLVLFSDKVNIDLFWLNLKPETNTQYFIFSLLWGYFAGLNGIIGHELLHKKERINKVVGTWAYTKFMYSHFLEEHIQGHHKYVATLEDPATARKNESLFAFIPRSVIGGHIQSWKREVSRIRRDCGEDVSMLSLVLKNKMTFYFLLHSSICLAIYHFLGWESLKY
jgi:alkane 1-monooxygenase